MKKDVPWVHREQGHAGSLEPYTRERWGALGWGSWEDGALGWGELGGRGPSGGLGWLGGWGPKVGPAHGGSDLRMGLVGPPT